MLNSFVSNLSTTYLKDNILKITRDLGSLNAGEVWDFDTHWQVSMNMKVHMAHLEFRSQDNSVKK